VPVVIGGDNLPSPVGIGLTDLPNIWFWHHWISDTTAQVFVMCMTPALIHFQVNINIPLKNKRERSKSPAVAAGKNKPVVLPPPSAAAMAAGILPPGGAAANPFASQAPKLSAPPIKPANQSWIKF